MNDPTATYNITREMVLDGLVSVTADFGQVRIEIKRWVGLNKLEVDKVLRLELAVVDLINEALK